MSRTRQLTLIRHAKSTWDDARTKDRDRPLNERGERDAPAMGRRLAGLAREPKHFVEYPAGGHSDLYLPPNNALDAVRAWVAGLGTGR